MCCQRTATAPARAAREMYARLSTSAPAQVRNAAAHGTLELYAVVLELLGTERVDRSWVSAAYQADLPPLEKDGRREARTKQAAL